MLAAAVFAAAGRAALAQSNAPPDEGPVIVGENKDKWRAFELKSFGAAIEINTRYRNDQLRQDGLPDLNDRELRQREYFDLTTELYIGHKNLIDFTGTAQLGLEDRFLDTDTTQSNTHESNFTDLYNLNALILANSFVPTSVYTRRDESIIDQPFTGTIDALTNETGIVSNIRSTVAPTTIRAFHLDYNQSSPLGQFDSSLVQNTASIQSNIFISANNKLDVNYTFDQIQETQGSTFTNDRDRHDGLLTDTYTFGTRGENQLRSFLRYYEETGNFPYQTLRWDEQLLLTHSDRLETRYNTTVERISRDTSDQTLGRGEANIRHKLFDSLVSNGTVGGQYFTTSENFDSSDIFFNGQLEYTKLVPKGRFDSTVGAGMNFQQNSEQGSTISVIDEPHTFNDPFPIVLSRRNIVEGSVRMTGLGGFPTYIENTDFTVQYFPDRAEVRIVAGRGIVDGQTLLFDYDVGPEQANDITTLDTSINLRYTFTETFMQGLSVYTSYRTRDNHVDAKDPSQIVLDNTQVLLYGADYRRGGLTLRAEQERRESNVNPYDTTRLQAIYDLVLGPGSLVTADVSYDLIDYSNPENTTQFLRASARWEQRLMESFFFNLRLEYRNEQDDLSGNSDGFEQHVGFRWKYRQTSVFGEFTNSFLTSDTSDQTSQMFELGLRRDF